MIAFGATGIIVSALVAGCGGGSGGGGYFGATAATTSTTTPGTTVPGSTTSPTTSGTKPGGTTKPPKPAPPPPKPKPTPTPAPAPPPPPPKPQPLTKPHAIWKPAAHFTNASLTKRTGIVIHKAEGYNAAGWFANPASKASANYDVHQDGKIYQMVKDEDVAWHCGNTAYNTSHIGIEHAGFSAKADITDKEYEASAKLVAWLCDHYKIPIDRKHIIGHAEVPDPNHPGQFGGINHHTDPGKLWDWNRYLALVKKYAQGAPAPSSPSLRVAAWLPYWAGAAGDATVKAQAGKGLDEVDMFSYGLEADGTLNVLAGARDAALIAAVHNNKGTVYMTVTGAASSSVVPDPAKRAVFMKACLDECVKYDLDGVDLDFESMRSQDRADFTKLCAELGKALAVQKKKLSITVIAKQQDRVAWGAADALDYAALGKIADRFKIMTYGLHGSWGSPGPIGSLPWMESVLKFALSQGVPKGKIFLGVPFFGYDWTAPKQAKSVSAAAAVALGQKATSGVQFDKTAGEAHFTYKDAQGVTHTVWFQTAASIKAKCELAKKYDLGGVACWSVNQEKADFWAALEAARK